MIEKGLTEDFSLLAGSPRMRLAGNGFPNCMRLAKSITRVDSFHAVDLLNVSFGVRSTTGGGRSPPSSGVGSRGPILGRRRPGERLR